MAEQTFESRTDFDPIDTSDLTLTLLDPLPESALKHALVEVMDLTRPRPGAQGGGFINKAMTDWPDGSGPGPHSRRSAFRLSATREK
ncbi:hypothetical protein GCM10023085_40740 [Actinomadura viridis]|uniref:Uncharacterized protein n=1 Tax=Actinomadura viridis TaxID=58110 RepID=A0A931DTZ6_9ACTN|nr:hypothetical protein [Actinomadura viridis]MBG6092648.1 hypothetical protein [Actinomadura viridis]